MTRTYCDGVSCVSVPGPGPTTRSRVLAETIRPGQDRRPQARHFAPASSSGTLQNKQAADTQSHPDALVRPPAEVLPIRRKSIPLAGWQCPITRVAPGGSDLLNACLLELATGGGLRDVAEPGTLDRALSSALFAWASPFSSEQSMVAHPCAGQLPGRRMDVCSARRLSDPMTSNSSMTNVQHCRIGRSGRGSTVPTRPSTKSRSTKTRTCSGCRWRTSRPGCQARSW